MEIKCSKQIIDLSKIFSKNDSKLFVVGGYIRDSLLGLKATDLDIASNLTFEQLKVMLDGTNFKVYLTSNKLGTCIIASKGFKAEHTTFRSEGYEDGGSHTPIDVVFVNTPHEDSERRDFTINSFYYDVENDTILDFYDGKSDLEKRRIKAIVSPKHVFSNDGLRILRMVRQAVELDFMIEDNTFLMARDMIDQLDDISKERIIKELKLIFNADKKYGFKNPNAVRNAIEYMLDLKLIPKLFKNSIEVPHLEVEDFSATLSCKRENRLVAFVWDIVRNNPEMEQCLNNILSTESVSLSNEERENIKMCVEALIALTKTDISYSFIAKYLKVIDTVTDLLQTNKNKIKQKTKEFYEKNMPKDLKELQIDGNDCIALGLEKEEIRDILNRMITLVFNEEIANEREALLDCLKKLYS